MKSSVQKKNSILDLKEKSLISLKDSPQEESKPEEEELLLEEAKAEEHWISNSKSCSPRRD